MKTLSCIITEFTNSKRTKCDLLYSDGSSDQIENTLDYTVRWFIDGTIATGQIISICHLTESKAIIYYRCAL